MLFFLNSLTASHFFFSVCFFLKKKKKNPGKKTRYFLKKGNVTGQLHGEKKAELCPPRPARRPRVQAGRPPGGGGADEGSGSWPLSSSGSGENPHLLATPHPLTPELLILESEGNEECGKYLKAAAGPGRLLGAASFPETV